MSTDMFVTPWKEIAAAVGDNYMHVNTVGRFLLMLEEGHLTREQIADRLRDTIATHTKKGAAVTHAP